MTITQTVEIPANHRITLEVPHEVPIGSVMLSFTPVDKSIISETTASTEEALKSASGILEKHLFAFKELAK